MEGLSCPNLLLSGFTTQDSNAAWSDARHILASNVIRTRQPLPFDGSLPRGETMS